jgi:hypothetical protein
MYNEFKDTTIAILALFLLTALLNMSTKLVVCSAIYVSLALIVNFLIEIYSKKEVIFIVISCILPNIILLVETPLNIMIISSFFSLIVSTCCAILLSDHLRSKLNFPLKNLIILISCSFVDTVIVSTSLLTKYSLGKSITVAFYDMAFKTFYLGIASLLIYGVYYIKNFSIKRGEVNGNTSRI